MNTHFYQAEAALSMTKSVIAGRIIEIILIITISYKNQFNLFFKLQIDLPDLFRR
jgi:hypothetical protein